MSIAEKYQRFARECIELAGQTPNADARETMLEMAEAWVELAIAAAKERKPEKTDVH